MVACNIISSGTYYSILQLTGTHETLMRLDIKNTKLPSKFMTTTFKQVLKSKSKLREFIKEHES